MLVHLVLRGQLDAAHDDVAGVPGLSIEHVECVELVLHADVEELRVLFPHHALIEAQRPHPVRRLEAQIIGEEGEMMQIARAQDYRIDFLRGPILEISGLVLEPLKQRMLLEILRPVEAHRLRAVARGDRFRPIFPALRADILGRIAAPDDEHVLALEFERVAEVM